MAGSPTSGEPARGAEQLDARRSGGGQEDQGASGRQEPPAIGAPFWRFASERSVRSFIVTSSFFWGCWRVTVLEAGAAESQCFFGSPAGPGAGERFQLGCGGCGEM